MLEPYEVNRPSFLDLKEALPDYQLVQEYFKEQDMMLGRESTDNSFNFMEKQENLESA